MMIIYDYFNANQFRCVMRKCASKEKELCFPSFPPDRFNDICTARGFKRAVRAYLCLHILLLQKFQRMFSTAQLTRAHV